MSRLQELSSEVSLFRKQWLPTELAIQRIAMFAKEFGTAHLALACHAALASILTPELVNLIRINFLEKTVEWIAESDLLLSPLCYPIGEDIFEIEPRTRELLLVGLKSSAIYGLKRQEEVALLLYGYTNSRFAKKRTLNLTRIHRWIANAYFAPDETVINMFDTIRNIRQEERLAKLPAQIQVGKTLELLAEPLRKTSLQG
jgi:hypothetical protein